MEEEPMIRRVRVVFDDHRHLLTKPQRLDGLKKCWLLLRPKLATISDLSSHLSRRFHLRRSCPLGLVLSMDGFVLPSFESTYILNDGDIIRVRKKDSKLKALEKANGDYHIQKNLDIVERLPIRSSGEVMVNKDTHEELEEYKANKSCDLQIGTSTGSPLVLDLNSKRKRADPDVLQKSERRKKSKLMISDKPVVSDEDTEFVPLLQRHLCSTIADNSCDRSHVKEELLREKGKSNAVTFYPVGCSAMKTTDCVLNGRRTDQVGESSKVKQSDPCIDGSKKLPSRNARRKKASREWLKELNLQNKNHTLSCVPAKAIQMTSSDHSTVDLDAVMENEITPIVVRPGHIRFETADRSKELQHAPDDLQWHGTSNKKREGWLKGINAKKVFVSEVEQLRKYNVDEGKSPIVHIDFERLFPLTRPPKEGDVVAYRMIELSSAWSAELSSFRVGKVSLYDPVSMKICLVPIPDYPFNLPDKKDAESSEKPNVSPYNEDGSLEIEYRSLVDVRLFKTSNKGASNAHSFGRQAFSADNWELAIKSTKETYTTHMGSWDQFVQSSNEAPKLVENDGWREWPKENPGIALWFDYCRSLRESKSFFPKRDNWKSKSGKPNGVRVRYFHHPLKFGK
ncbi:coilin-like [Dioscorea cayenensis subsp. rotundata]|uniref:Coilin-like n=1 Tax=Dioscorea cayennensis subsp. rotundata TaxID=55577 RepID=A0AB40BD63_DIOCR|nr:coilin-like [Dioscorea cayenensis subsp. rotundata]